MWGSSAPGADFSLAVSIVGIQASSEAGGAEKLFCSQVLLYLQDIQCIAG